MEHHQILRTAVIGCGCISCMHAEAIKGLANVSLVACADLVPQRAAAFAAQYGGMPYTDYRELLRCETPDAVHVCTPHDTHMEIIEAAARMGIAVFTEKPPALSQQELARMDAAEKFAPIGICFQNRFNGAVQEVQRLVREQKTGNPKGARAFVTWHREAAYYEQSPWRAKMETAGGGSLMTQAIHTLDLLVQFMGTPHFVEATTANHHLRGIAEVEDTVEAYIGFGDCSALFYSSNAYCEDERVMVEVCFENVTARIEETELLLRWKNGEVQHLSFAEQNTASKRYWGMGHGLCVEAFYDSIRSGQPFAVSPATVKATMRTLFGIYESAKTNRRIDL